MIILIKNIFKNLFYLFLPLVVGLVSSAFTRNSPDFYKTLEQPPFAPPGFVFPIVWSILFLLIGISFYLLKKQSKGYDISNAEFWYYLQLIINFFWSIFFFRNQALTFSFLWLVFLLITVIVTFIKFKRIYKPSAYLLIPYIVWIIFAGYLNLSIAILN